VDIGAGYTKINAESGKISYPGASQLQKTGNAGKGEYRNRNNPLSCSIGKGLKIYQYTPIWCILYKTGRNRENFWRLRQKIGYMLLRAAKRGGNWNNSSGKAGVFALNLNNEPSNRNNNIGFRASLILTLIAGVVYFMEYIRVLLVPRTYILVKQVAKNMKRWIVAGRNIRTSQSIVPGIL
jgi:hypothetical protein